METEKMARRQGKAAFDAALQALVSMMVADNEPETLLDVQPLRPMYSKDSALRNACYQVAEITCDLSCRVVPIGRVEQPWRSRDDQGKQMEDKRLMTFEDLYNRRQAGRLTADDAAEILGVSTRTFRRCRAGFEEEVVSPDMVEFESDADRTSAVAV